MGLRYRVATRPAPGLRVRADLVFSGSRVAVFIDGCFWHGCAAHASTPRTNTDYGPPRSARNRDRDAEASRELVDAGWTVVRVWEHDDPVRSAANVRAAVDAGVRPALGGARSPRYRILRGMSSVDHWDRTRTCRARSTRSAGTSPTRSSRVSWSLMPSGTAPEASSTSAVVPRVSSMGSRPRAREGGRCRHLGGWVGRGATRLGRRAVEVEWIVGDIAAISDIGHFDIWHDRAVFHFLLDPEARHRYAELAGRTVNPGGAAIVATFAADGPERCSGLPVSALRRRGTRRGVRADVPPHGQCAPHPPHARG